MLHVGKVVVALADAGRTPEVIDSDRRVPALGETQSELLVEAVETANVGEDDDGRSGGLVGQRRKSGQSVSVGRLQYQILVRHGCARNDRDGRQGVELEAHGRPTIPTIDLR